MRLLIIGGDAAGMSAASQARRNDPNLEIVVLEASRDVSYGACGLPYKIPDGHDMEDLQAVSLQRFREERHLDVRLEHVVDRVLPDEHRVQGEGPDGRFEESYDRLVIATGARVIRPPIPGLDDLWGRGAYPLKTLQDGRDLKAAVQAGPASVLIIGGGYIGLEASEGFREQGLEVTVVEALSDILLYVPQEIRERVHAEAERRGVAIKLGTRVERLERAAPEGPITAHTSAGALTADIVLVATGVRPNSEFAAEAGLKLGDARSIAVNEYLETSAADI